LSKEVTPGDYVSVSYFPGILTGTDGSRVNAFGPEGLYNPEPEPEKLFYATEANFINIYPNPADGLINIVATMLHSS